MFFIMKDGIETYMWKIIHELFEVAWLKQSYWARVKEISYS